MAFRKKYQISGTVALDFGSGGGNSVASIIVIDKGYITNKSRVYGAMLVVATQANSLSTVTQEFIAVRTSPLIDLGNGNFKFTIYGTSLISKKLTGTYKVIWTVIF